MALYLVELTPAQPSKDEATALIETVNSSLTNGAELIETQVSADHKIVFVIVESENTAFGPDLAAAIGRARIRRRPRRSPPGRRRARRHQEAQEGRRLPG